MPGPRNHSRPRSPRPRVRDDRADRVDRRDRDHGRDRDGADRHRPRTRERDRERGYDRDRRDRSRSPPRRSPLRRSYRSRSPDRRSRQAVPFGQRSVDVDPTRHIKEAQAKQEAEAAGQRAARLTELQSLAATGDESSEAELMALLGLPAAGFATTKFKHVADGASNLSGVKVVTQRKARQYMNRPDKSNKAPQTVESAT